MKIKAKELKRQARAALNGYYGPAATAYMMSLLFGGILTSLQDLAGLSMIPGNARNPLVWIAFLIVSLLTSLIAAGFAHMLYQIKLGLPFNFQELFYVFRNNPDHYIVAAFLSSICCDIWLLPALLLASRENVSLPLLLAAAVIGLCISVVFQCMFSQYLYLLFEDRQLSGIAALKQSARMMKGQKFRFFRMTFSFIGMYLCGVMTFGLGFFWVMPYIQMTEISFHISLRESLGMDAQAEVIL